MNLFSPSSTIFRVRRKRGADPLAGLVVSSKKPKTEEIYEIVNTNNLQSQEIIFRLIGTSDVPHVKSAAPFLDRDHKVIEMVDYNPERNSLGSRQISVLDKEYLEVTFYNYFFY